MAIGTTLVQGCFSKQHGPVGVLQMYIGINQSGLVGSDNMSGWPFVSLSALSLFTTYPKPSHKATKLLNIQWQNS